MSAYPRYCSALHILAQRLVLTGKQRAPFSGSADATDGGKDTTFVRDERGSKYRFRLVQQVGVQIEGIQDLKGLTP